MKNQSSINTIHFNQSLTKWITFDQSLICFDNNHLRIRNPYYRVVRSWLILAKRIAFTQVTRVRGSSRMKCSERHGRDH